MDTVDPYMFIESAALRGWSGCGDDPSFEGSSYGELIADERDIVPVKNSGGVGVGLMVGGDSVSVIRERTGPVFVIRQGTTNRSDAALAGCFCGVVRGGWDRVCDLEWRDAEGVLFHAPEAGDDVARWLAGDVVVKNPAERMAIVVPMAIGTYVVERKDLGNLVAQVPDVIVGGYYTLVRLRLAP